MQHALDPSDVVGRDGDQEGVKLGLVEEAHVGVHLVRLWLLDELARIRGRPSTADGVLEDAVQQADVVERRLHRLAVAPSRSDEPLDVVMADAGQRPFAEVRGEMDPEEGLVALLRGALAPEALQVGEQSRAAVADRQAIDDRRCRQLSLDPPPHLPFALCAREALAASGRTDRPDLSLDAPAVAVPAPVPVA